MKRLIENVDQYFTYPVARIVYLHHNYTADVAEIASVAKMRDIDFVAVRYELCDFKTFPTEVCGSGGGESKGGACLAFADDCTTIIDRNASFAGLLNDIRHHNVYMILGLHTIVYNNATSRSMLGNLQFVSLAGHSNLRYFLFTITGRSRATILRFASSIGLKNAASLALSTEEQEGGKYCHLLFDLMPGSRFRLYTNIFPTKSRYTNVFIEK